MEATLKASSLKTFTKALTCLSRYGDQLTLHATNDNGLSLSTTNSSKSAYARFVFQNDWWAKWNVRMKQPGGTLSSQEAEEEDVKGEVGVKVLLSILRARAVEKTVDKVELEIYDGPDPHSTKPDERDELESRLIIRMHCKQGVTKTHRLNLSVPTVILGPRVPEATAGMSRLRIGPDAIKDILEHFPSKPTAGGKGKGRDPQLLWEFGATKVKVRSVDAQRGSDAVNTELSMDVDEFDEYVIPNTPISMSWHLREFSATITHAEQLNLPLEMQFSKPSEPLFIEINTTEDELEGKGTYETFFAIATTFPSGDADGETAPQPNADTDKRPREETAPIADRRPSKRKQMSVVQPQSTNSVSSSQMIAMPSRRATQLPSLMNGSNRIGSMRPPPTTEKKESNDQEPLFSPAPSQLSQHEQNILKEAGLGDGDMGYVDFEAMIAGDDELEAAVNDGATQGGEDGPDSSATEEDNEDELEGTQRRPASRNFEPLFDD